MLRLSKLCLVFTLLLSSGCSWIALLDTSNKPISNTNCDKKLQKVLKEETVSWNSQYIGFTKEKINSELGKPKKVIRERWPYELNGKESHADEVWFFEFVKYVSSCGKYAYSVYVYFKNGKVVFIR